MKLDSPRSNCMSFAHPTAVGQVGFPCILTIAARKGTRFPVHGADESLRYEIRALISLGWVSMHVLDWGEDGFGIWHFSISVRRWSDTDWVRDGGRLEESRLLRQDLGYCPGCLNQKRLRSAPKCTPRGLSYSSLVASVLHWRRPRPQRRCSQPSHPS